MHSSERLDKTKLVDFLGIVDKELSRKITLVAAGGTAMTLLDIKPSTVDVDFTGSGDDISEFEQVLRNIPHGFKVDCWKDGMVFSQILPDNYLKKSMLAARMKKIELRALHPLDIVATKIGRLDERDQEDIRDCIQKFRLTKSEIAKRAKQVQYVGREANYQANLEYVLNRFFRN